MKNRLDAAASTGFLLLWQSHLFGLFGSAVRTARQWCLSHKDFLAQALLVLVAGLMRFWRIETPHEFVFDEVYFPVFAKDYLDGITFFDAHPPLGKYLIALGIRFFGFIPLGYRVMSALFGVGVIILIYRLALQLFENRRVALLAGLLACTDGLLLVESRAGLINIFAIFFSLAAYHLFLKVGEEATAKPAWLYLFGAGFCIGAAVAVKWIGVASFGVVLTVYLAARTARQWPRATRFVPTDNRTARISKIHPDLFALCCVLLPIIVYASSFTLHLRQNPDFPFFELQRQMLGYHAHLTEGHGYASQWWSWPLLIRPVNYFYETVPGTEQIRTIVNLGNPILWWLAIPGFCFATYFAAKRRHFGTSFALLAAAAHYLPFALISRASFLYHFMGTLPFMILLLALALDKLSQSGRFGREMATLAIAAIVLCAVYYYPIWTALPLPTGAFYQRMWLASWI